MPSVAETLSSYSFACTTEAELQESIARVLVADGHSFVREYRISESERVDFWLDGLALEAKILGSFTSVLRQLDRYAACPESTAVMLVTTRSQHRAMPSALRGKPVTVIYLPGAFA